jgi:hypothetical protein
LRFLESFYPARIDINICLYRLDRICPKILWLLARRWPKVLGNAVDPAWARTKMGGPGAPVDLDTGQRPQSWLAVSDDPAAMVSGHYRQEQPAHEATDPEFQDELANTLGELTGVALPQA